VSEDTPWYLNDTKLAEVRRKRREAREAHEQSWTDSPLTMEALTSHALFESGIHRHALSVLEERFATVEEMVAHPKSDILAMHRVGHKTFKAVCALLAQKDVYFAPEPPPSPGQKKFGRHLDERLTKIEATLNELVALMKEENQ
jgi:hypothetical protein